MWWWSVLAAVSTFLLTCGRCVRVDLDDASTSKTVNCKRPLGALMLNTDDAQKALVTWRSLPAEPWNDMSPNPVFIMLVYNQISFPQAWEAVFNSSSEQQDSFKLLVHAKDEIAQESLPPFFKSRLVANFQQTRRCSAVKLILNLLTLCLKARQQASHFVILSGDSMPTKPLGHMLKDLQIESRSRFCVDPELRRAETFFAMRRDLASFLVKHFEKIFKHIVPATSCPDEDMFYWSAYQRGEGTVNSCIQMSDWSNTDKEWRTNSERCKCPKFLSSVRMKSATCGRPSLWGAIRREGLNEIFQSPAGYWLIRKFPGDKLPGNAQLIDGSNEAEVLAALRAMHADWEKSGNLEFSALDTGSEVSQETRPKEKEVKESATSSSDKPSQNHLSLKVLKQSEALDSATAKLIVEQRNKRHIPLQIVPDPESEELQQVRKAADASGGQNPDISGFPHWTTFNRIDMNGLVFGKTIGMLVTAFD